ncbi:MAG: HAD family hydrolase [Anaerolineae bacterium]|nr:HAD family hydrolase [Anaerolineae bacterium]
MELDPSAIDALLFDLDGTLLDSDDEGVEALARWLDRLGMRDARHRARRIVMRMETPVNALMTALDTVGLDTPLLSLSEWLRHQRRRATPRFRIVPGSEDALRLLARSYRLAVVTTRGRRDAQAFLESFGLSDLFEVVITRESTWRLKPHAAPIRYAAGRLDLPPDRCAMVGDTPVDMRSARQAGAWAIGVLCGFGEKEELERAGAHLIVPSPADLPLIFESTAKTRTLPTENQALRRLESHE